MEARNNSPSCGYIITNYNSKSNTYIGTVTGSNRQEFVQNLVTLINNTFPLANLANGTVLTGSATWSGQGYCGYVVTRNSGGANITVQIGGEIVSALIDTRNLAISAFTDLNSKPTVNAIQKNNISLDTLTTPGVYSCNNCTETPNGWTRWFNVRVLPNGGGGDGNTAYAIQIATPLSSNEIYIRHCDSGTWRAWEKLVMDSNVPSQNYLDYWTVYPNGKLYNKTYFTLTIPFFNPKNKTPSVSSAYVYNDTGSFVDIKSSVTIETANNLFVYIQVIFDAGYAGRLARFTITLS